MSTLPVKVGKPTTYTDEIADVICGRIATGESLRQICRSDGFPPESTVRSWVMDDEKENGEKTGISARYALARRMQADTWADEIMDIADDGTNDWMEKYDKDGNSTGYVLNGEHVQRSRLRVDSRKWILSKLRPEKYADRLETSVDVTFNLIRVTRGERQFEPSSREIITSMED